MEVSEIKTHMSSLEKAESPEKIHEILDALQAGVKPSEKLLRETKLGIAVNKLRSHSDKEISDKVKKIIKTWKDAVSAQKEKNKAAKLKSSRSASPNDSSTSNNTNSTAQSTPTEKAKFTSHGKERNAKNDGVRTDIYDDKVRNSCVDLCYTSLALGSDVPPGDILACAKAVEQAVYSGEKGTGGSYRTKMRSLYSNLKDQKNPQLRQRVVSGDISPERLYKMSPQEMASEDLKKEMKKLEEENLFKARGATEQRAITDRFTCGKCKQKKVSYYQMQTRSADEPLTTFCTCENCGNRWKFS